ncbi:hypothetical protein PMAYCL1PPCAC_01350, partial [Pristionchus mayeri]
AILMSGSSLSEFAQSEKVVEESKKLAHSLNCSVSPSEEALECLRKFTSIEILEAVDNIGSSRRHPDVVTFGPHIDGDFFPCTIQELAVAAPKKRTLSGATDQESGMFVMNEDTKFIVGIAPTKEQRESFSRRDLVD